MKRMVAILISLGIVASLLAGCSGNTNNTPSVSEPVSVVSSGSTDITEEPVSEVADNTLEEITPSELPGGEDAVVHFLENFSWWTDEYDCADRSLYYDFVQFMLSCQYTICDFDLYSDYLSEPVGAEEYYCYDGGGVDWVLTNIYNISSGNLDDFKEQLSQTEAETGENGEKKSLLYKDGKYYAIAGGVGGGTKVEIKQVETDGELYYVTYDIYWENFSMDGDEWDYSSSNYAMMEYKTIDGKDYWSIYDERKKSD